MIHYLSQLPLRALPAGETASAESFIALPASPSDNPTYLTAFTVVLWYDMPGPPAVGLKYNLLKGRECEVNGAVLYNNARRLQTDE
jgi:hypothetical protein